MGSPVGTPTWHFSLLAGIRGGRLVAVHSGRCDVTATLAIQDAEVIGWQVHLELPGIIPLGRGIGLRADHGHSGDPGGETSQASVAWLLWRACLAGHAGHRLVWPRGQAGVRLRT